MFATVRKKEPAVWRLMVWTFGANGFLCAIKIAAGLLLNSKALLADGLHSLTDFASDFTVLFGIQMGATPGDREHPYGHHKFVSFSKLGIAAFLMFASFWMIGTAVFSVHQGSIAAPGFAAGFVAGFSVLVKELLFRATQVVARTKRSDLLMANAWHHRSDSGSSAGVALALFASAMGGPAWAFLDPLAAVVVGVLIALESGKIGKRALGELVDAAPARNVLDDLREHILPHPGVLGYHDFRARRVGDRLHVDFHLQVAPKETVEDAHATAREVKKILLTRHPEVEQVLIHLEPATPEHLVDKGLSEQVSANNAFQEGGWPPRNNGE